jgi:hypothetical protein
VEEAGLDPLFDTGNSITGSALLFLTLYLSSLLSPSLPLSAQALDLAAA